MLISNSIHCAGYGGRAAWLSAVKSMAKYVTGHDLHGIEPGVILYLPVAQVVQSFPTPPVHPALQMQSEIKLLPSSEPFLNGHGVHGSEPLADLYLPAVQSKQLCPSAPVEPALHLQAEIEMLPKGELEFTGHLWHSEFTGNDLYVPVAHCTHTILLSHVPNS